LQQVWEGQALYGASRTQGKHILAIGVIA